MAIPTIVVEMAASLRKDAPAVQILKLFKQLLWAITQNRSLFSGFCLFVVPKALGTGWYYRKEPKDDLGKGREYVLPPPSASQKISTVNSSNKSS